jgi:hypothetical protein
MNKKLFVGAALTTVVVGGFVYYRYIKDRDVAKEIRIRALKLFEEDETEDPGMVAWEESLVTKPAPEPTA